MGNNKKGPKRGGRNLEKSKKNPKTRIGPKPKKSTSIEISTMMLNAPKRMIETGHSEGRNDYGTTTLTTDNMIYMAI